MNTIKTASFHIVKPCNMKCKFCYATFEDFKVGKQMDLSDAKKVINKLKSIGIEKITFAGGEPMLYKNLTELIIYTKNIGITTSLITNGSLITKKWLKYIEPYLDWIGVSIDSLDETINKKIGRTSKLNVDYYDLFNTLDKMNFKLKVNTVVNHYNKEDILLPFIQKYKIQRWKVFQALRVEEQNDAQWNEIKVSEEDFNTYLKNNNYINIVPENNELMTGSYLLIDPLGRLFENTKGKHTYSKSIIDNEITKCLEEINLNQEMFIKRGGIYDW
jgi:radical S-adenosyl methionine domain-containing protein 2